MSDSGREEKEAKVAQMYHSGSASKSGEGAPIFPVGDEVIAGSDDRRDYFDLRNLNVPEELLKQLADSTVILTDRTDVTEQADGSFRLDVGPFQRGGMSACGGEKFANQHIGGWCSGFVVGPDVIATAGHCGETEAEIQATAYVFGFRVDDKNDPGATILSADQVYFGKELIAHDLSPTGDFAIVRVDRNIVASGASPLEVRSSDSISVGANIGVIGYPSGLPVKIAFGVDTVVMKDDDPWLLANLDTYGGNSGSAVFNVDGQVEGILVRGAQDYVTDPVDACFRSNRIMNAEGSEAVTKASVFVDQIP